MKFFVKDFCESVQARVVIFGMQVDNYVLYRGIANQPSPDCSSLYFSNFLSFHTLNDKSFVKDFCESVQARVFICGMQVDNDVLLRNWAAACYFQVYLRCRVLGRTGRLYKWCANFNQELHPLNLMSSDIRSLVEGITCEICFFYLFMTFWPF